MTGIASTISFAGISVLLALSCFVVLKAGEISFGQQAFFGIGAYAGGMLTAVFEWALLPAIIGAILAGSLVAFAVSFPLSRLSGFRFTLTTLVTAEFIRELLVRFVWLEIKSGKTVGPEGVLGFSGIDYFYDHRIGTWAQAAGITITVIACAVLVAMALKSSRGQELLAASSDVHLAESIGIDPIKRKRQALVLAGGLASLGGALFAHHATYIDATNFGVMMGVHAIAYVLIGGIANVIGPIIGTLVDVVLLEWLRVFGPYRMVAFGSLLVAVLVLRPNGIIARRASK